MARVVWNTRPLENRIHAQIVAICERVGLVFKERVAADTPVDTGAARDSVYLKVDAQERRISIQVGGTVSYFVWLELGTRGRPGHGMLASNFDDAQQKLLEELAKIGLKVKGRI